MERLGLLWIDFTSSGSPPDLFARLDKTLHVQWLPAGDDLPARIKAFQPHILCFDFDYPKLVEMLLLRQIKAVLPSVPILMLSRHHSADLVLWALRSRVWNYFQKPLDAPDFLAAVRELRALLEERQGSARRMVMPAVASASDAEPVNPRNAKAVNKAKAYVQANLGEDLTAAKLAEVCCMSYFHFSRTFKRVAGQSFNDFVQQVRIRKAGELLAHPNATITRVCLEVGFKEVSYFARVFRLVVGVSPTEFRRMVSEAPRGSAGAMPPEHTHARSAAGRAESGAVESRRQASTPRLTKKAASRYACPEQSRRAQPERNKVERSRSSWVCSTGQHRPNTRKHLRSP